MQVTTCLDTHYCYPRAAHPQHWIFALESFSYNLRALRAMQEEAVAEPPAAVLHEVSTTMGSKDDDVGAQVAESDGDSQPQHPAATVPVAALAASPSREVGDEPSPEQLAVTPFEKPMNPTAPVISDTPGPIPFHVPASPSTPTAPTVILSRNESYAMLRATFDAIDKDRSGACSSEEIFAAVDDLELGISPERLAKSISEADVDGSGEIEFDEFIALMRHLLYDEQWQPRSKQNKGLPSFQALGAWEAILSFFWRPESQSAGTPEGKAGGKARQQQEEGQGAKRVGREEPDDVSSPSTRRSRTPSSPSTMRSRTPKTVSKNPGYKQPNALKSGRNTPAMKFKDASQAKDFFTAPVVPKGTRLSTTTQLSRAPALSRSGSNVSTHAASRPGARAAFGSGTFGRLGLAPRLPNRPVR